MTAHPPVDARDGTLRPVVAVSGGPGTGTTTLCERLSVHFSLPHVYAGAIFRGMAASRGMTLADFGRFAESHPEVDRELDARMIAVAKAGGVILEGRLSPWHVREAGTPAFRVLLTAPDEIRAARVARRDGGTTETVLRINREREASEAKRYHSFYAFDPTEPKNYDLVVDTGPRSPDEVFEVVAPHVTEVLRR